MTKEQLQELRKWLKDRIDGSTTSLNDKVCYRTVEQKIKDLCGTTMMKDG